MTAVPMLQHPGVFKMAPWTAKRPTFTHGIWRLIDCKQPAKQWVAQSCRLSHLNKSGKVVSGAALACPLTSGPFPCSSTASALSYQTQRALYSLAFWQLLFPFPGCSSDPSLTSWRFCVGGLKTNHGFLGSKPFQLLGFRSPEVLPGRIVPSPPALAVVDKQFDRDPLLSGQQVL